ncbi:hypothetical protein ANN_25212, partial [Periplaneta americana]
LIAVPGDPQDVRATFINSTAIRVQWRPPLEKERNGIIRGYHIHVQETKEEGQSLLNDPMRFDVLDGNAQELNVTGLQPDTKYSVQVAALTRKGDGDRSTPITVKTPGGVPNRPTVNLKRLRGLGVFKAQWEAYLQHLNICQRLLHVDNPHVAATRNLPNEIEHCIKQLPITFDCSERFSSQKLRKALREDSFHQWSKLKSKGLGVVFYSHWKKGNSWISTKKGLSSSQWTQAIKMNCNTIPVRTLPGRTLDSTRCRRCDEQETLPHVLGFCHHGELLRINRHNTVRSLIAASIRQNALRFMRRVLEREPTVSIELEWGKPTQTYGELLGYRLRYGVKDQMLKEQMFKGTMVHSHKINDLERGVEYEFRVAGQNHIGFGQESIKYLLTPEGPPTGPPTNISHRFQTPDVVCVTWDVPLREHRNGQITHYDIEFHKKVDHTTVIDRNTTQTKVQQSSAKVSLE